MKECLPSPLGQSIWPHGITFRIAGLPAVGVAGLRIRGFFRKPRKTKNPADPVNPVKENFARPCPLCRPLFSHGRALPPARLLKSPPSGLMLTYPEGFYILRHIQHIGKGDFRGGGCFQFAGIILQTKGIKAVYESPGLSFRNTEKTARTVAPSEFRTLGSGVLQFPGRRSPGFYSGTA